MHEILQAVLAWVQADPSRLIDIALYVIAGASILVAGTKTPDPNTRLGRLYRLLEWLALTVGRAKDIGPRVGSPSRRGPPPAAVGVVALVALALAACSSVQLHRSDAEPTPAQRVVALELDYQQAQRLALALRPELPAETWRHVQRLESVAYQTLSAAREAARRGDDVGLPAALAAARSAIEALADYLGALVPTSDLES